MELASISVIVIGVSQGGLEALSTLLAALPQTFEKAIIIVQHRAADSDSYLSEHLNLISPMQVKEAQDKEPIRPGIVYIAPADYHLLVEKQGTLSLSDDERVNYTRPAIDVLFETAADCYGAALLGVVLTGNNSDGARGLKTIKDLGGTTVIQDPQDAQVPAMPLAAQAITIIDYALPLKEMPELFIRL